MSQIVVEGIWESRRRGHIKVIPYNDGARSDAGWLAHDSAY